MNQTEFERLTKMRLEACLAMLNSKAAEYAEDEDRLHNFHVAAQVQGNTPRQALGGMLAKHIVSIYDMIGSGELGRMYQWEEKLGDAINYLLLLNAMVTEEITKDWDNAGDQASDIVNESNDEKSDAVKDPWACTCTKGDEACGGVPEKQDDVNRQREAVGLPSYPMSPADVRVRTKAALRDALSGGKDPFAPDEPDKRESAGSILARMGTDGVKWAAEFTKIPNWEQFVLSDGGAPGGFLHGWLTNAIEAGKAAGRSENVEIYKVDASNGWVKHEIWVRDGIVTAERPSS